MCEGPQTGDPRPRVALLLKRTETEGPPWVGGSEDGSEGGLNLVGEERTENPRPGSSLSSRLETESSLCRSQ